MDEPAVRERAEAFCEAIVAGNIDRAIEDFSRELRQHLGEVLTLFPMPSTEATVESIEHGASSYVVVLRFVGDNEEAQVQTRWKDRDGRPTIVEASHLSRVELAAAAGETENGEGSEDTGAN